MSSPCHQGVFTRRSGRAIADWSAREWKGVLFEHVSQRTIIDNATTYVNVFAEGLSRFARVAAAGSSDGLRLDITIAHRSLPRESNVNILDRTPPEAYISRILERLTLEHIRDPLVGANRWQPRLAFRGGTRDARLMLADLLCHGWYRQRRGQDARSTSLHDFIAPHHHRTLRAHDADRIRQHLEDGDHVQALIELGDHLTYGENRHPAWLKDAIRDVQDRLLKLSSRSRDAALRASLARLDQLMEHDRDLGTAEIALARWRTHLLGPLLERLSGDGREALLAIEFERLRLDLATANHQGQTGRARSIRADLGAIAPILTRRFEHLPAVLDVRIHEAVHRSNLFCFDEAHAAMVQLDERLEAITGLLDELTEQTGQVVRSELRGKALGTALQAARMAARRVPSMLVEARRLSELAIRHFEHPADVQRQAGYRFEIELDAADLVEARGWLAVSVGLSREASVADIAAACARESGQASKPFWLYHMAWLWSRAVELGAVDLADACAGAWKLSDLESLLADDWLTQHPGPVMSWKLGLARAARRVSTGLPWLERAIEACERQDSPTMQAIGLGIRADRLALLAGEGADGTYRKGMKEFEEHRARLAGRDGAIAAYLAVWPTRHPGREDPAAAQHWRELARDIPY